MDVRTREPITTEKQKQSQEIGGAAGIELCVSPINAHRTWSVLPLDHAPFVLCSLFGDRWLPKVIYKLALPTTELMTRFCVSGARCVFGGES